MYIKKFKNSRLEIFILINIFVLDLFKLVADNKELCNHRKLGMLLYEMIMVKTIFSKKTK